METPILSKNQQKNALSSKKKSRVTIKNVVASPYNCFWPQISHEDNTKLTGALEKYLPRIKTPRTSVPWDILKSVPRGERKQFREDYSDVKVENKKPESFGIVFGVNDVTKCLEKNELDSVLISSDVQPRLMVGHVIDMCVLNNCNVLIVEELRNKLKATCGFNSVVVGFKRSIHINSDLNFVLVEVKHISQHHPVPTDHINYYKRNNADVQKDVVSGSSGESKIKKRVISVIDVEAIQKSVYLLRNSNEKRTFVPTESSSSKDNPKVNDNFLSFGENMDTSKSLKIVKNYKPLVVKRLKGNPKRSKKNK
ncbi:unnamed protein product [Brassicogethes aeneus]|uniref:Ribosomal protein eL8/eL30/eS12/Gadd45 domain-containing protein n=1 Tax=Brassicogethes aeneus TaxID=1431903 RepID=A0A9P0FMN3_BRAAE|nr:unnamed protein product [Brassicogethes aeneus]